MVVEIDSSFFRSLDQIMVRGVLNFKETIMIDFLVKKFQVKLI